MKGLCIFVIVGALVALAFATQAPESRGNDFYVAFAYNYQNGLGQTQTLYISSDQATTVVVASKTTTISTVSVPAGGTVSVNVNSYYITAINTIQTMGLRVYSTDGKLFTLVGLNTYSATSDAFLAFPANVLGTNYMTAGYTACCGTAAYTYVVAPQDGTVVTIAGSRTLDGGGTTRTYTLNAFQTIAVGITNGDITGFTVNSNKPVAVFGGAACANIPSNVYACNVLVDQIPPTNTWDTDFITVPIATRKAGDVFRVVSNKTGTVVNVNGVNVATLAFGAWYEFSSSVPNVIHTSEPALVMQYDKGSSADGVTSDPFSIWIPPVNQYAANYYISTPTGSYWNSYVNIVVKSGAQSGILYDGAAITGVTWIPISGSSYVYCQKYVTGGGSHWISHTSPIEQFEVIVYGFGSYDGFGYVGGNRLSPLQDPCTATTTVAGDAIDNDCDGKVDEEIRNGVDDDGDGLIDEDLAVDTCCYSNKANPIFTPSTLADVTIYCGDSIPAPPSVSATVVCDDQTTYSVIPTINVGGSCPTSHTITRTYSYTDNCGRTTTLVQKVNVLTPAQICGNGVVEGTEQCDGQECCTNSCTFASASTICRSSNGDCDVAETCSGSSASCPADSFQSASTVCRASNGLCDVAETCSGSSASCPSDSFQSSSTVCRSSNGDCDVEETCSGSSASCPADSFKSSSTLCRSSAGVCDVEETCTGSSASCPPDSFQSSSTVCRPSVGPCDPSESCSGSDVSCPEDSNGSFETACPGLALMDSTFTNYDVIAFGDFTATTGDVEQRLAVGGNFNVGNGWSVGEKISGDDGHLTYSLVVNGNAYFGSGRVIDERVFVGGSFSEGSEWNGVAALVDHCPGNVVGCLTVEFEGARGCYSRYQDTLAAPADNTAHLIQWSGLYVTCNDPTSTTYYLSLTPSEMTSYSWTSVDSECNNNARWVINIRGTEDVPINGGSFPVPSSHVIYNILGSGRTVNIGPTQVEGSVLAPNNNINQPNGVILGKVVANNIHSLQINEHQCFNPVPPSK